MKKSFSLHFYVAFVLAYLVFDIIGLAIDAATWGHHRTSLVYDSVFQMLMFYLFTFLAQMIIGLVVWFIYKQAENKWMVLLTSLILLGYNLLFLINACLTDSDGYGFGLLFAAFPLWGPSNPFILSMYEFLDFFEVLIPSALYTVVTFLAILLSKNRNKAEDRQPTTSEAHQG